MYTNQNRSRTTRHWIDTTAEPIRNMHVVLSDWSRRSILYCLQEHDDAVAVTTVTEQLLTWQRRYDESGECDTVPVSEMRQQILQAHILKMEEFGILGYDPDADTVWIPEDVSISVTPPWDDPDSPRSPKNHDDRPANDPTVEA